MRGGMRYQSSAVPVTDCQPSPTSCGSRPVQRSWRDGAVKAVHTVRRRAEPPASATWGAGKNRRELYRSSSRRSDKSVSPSVSQPRVRAVRSPNASLRALGSTENIFKMLTSGFAVYTILLGRVRTNLGRRRCAENFFTAMTVQKLLESVTFQWATEKQRSCRCVYLWI